MNASAIWTILTQSFKDSLRAKWLLIFAFVYFFFAINVPLLNLFAQQYLPPNYLEQYLSSFIAVAYPYIPLLTLPMGAGVIVDERESGTLQYVMSNPISKVDFLLGRMLGMLLATTLVIVVGFGIASVFVYGSDLARYPPLLIATGAAVLLNTIMLFLAMSVSSLSKHKATAIGIAVVIWLLFTVISNLGTLSVFVNMRVGPWGSLPEMVLNPIDSAQNWATLALGNDITGTSSTGMIITAIFHQNTGLALMSFLLAWLAATFAVIFLLFRHQDVI